MDCGEQAMQCVDVEEFAPDCIHLVGSMSSESESKSSFSSPKYALAKTNLTAELYRYPPLGGSRRRLRYTTFAVAVARSPAFSCPTRFVALGTTSGSVRIFTQCTAAGQATQQLYPFLTLIHEDLGSSISALQFTPIEADYLNEVYDEYNEIDDDALCGGPGDASQPDTKQSMAAADATRSTSLQQPATESKFSQSYGFANLRLAIATIKGSLMLVEIKLTENNNKEWAVVYLGKSFTTHAISLLRWDNCHRLFLADVFGNLFVLHNTDFLRHLPIKPSPTLLISLQGVRFTQFDLIDEKLILFSTTEQKVFLLNLVTSECRPIGKARKGRATASMAVEHGVCILANYQFIELNHFNDENENEEKVANSCSSSSSSSNSNNTDGSSKFYRLVNTGFQLFATRPKWRIWVVDTEGVILFTHQFDSLIQHYLDNLSSKEGGQNDVDDDNENPVNLGIVGGSTNEASFGALAAMHWCNQQEVTIEMNNFLVTYTHFEHANRSQVYVIDPKERTIIVASEPIVGLVQDVRVASNQIYLMVKHDDSIDFIMFTMNELERPTQSPEDVATTEVTNDIIEVHNEPAKPKSPEIPSPPPLSAVQIKLHKLMYQMSFFSDLNLFTKCNCGLPIRDAFRCEQVDARRMKSILEADPLTDYEHVYQLLEMSYSNCNWTLYLYLLATFNEQRYYLHFAILLDESCLFKHHQTLFHCDNLLSNAAVWRGLFEFLQHLVANNWANPEAEKATPNESPTCLLCQLCQACRRQDISMILEFYEHRLVPKCLMFCSTKFVLHMLRQTMDKLDGVFGLKTFSAKMWLLVSRFLVHQANISVVATNVLKSFEQRKIAGRQQTSSPRDSEAHFGYLKMFNIGEPKLSTPRTLNLAEHVCAGCGLALHAKATKVRLFQSCDHLYHSPCNTQPYCTLCQM